MVVYRAPLLVKSNAKVPRMESEERVRMDGG